MQKRTYLETLSHKHLISLLLHATNLHPDLPIFPQGKSAADPASQPVAVNGVPGTDNAGANDLERRPSQDESYEEDLPYPKAGNGIILPPETEDLEWLLDDDCQAFSHTVNGEAVHMHAEMLNKTSRDTMSAENSTRDQVNGVLSVGA